VADIEIPVGPGDFEAIRLGKLSPTIDEARVSNARPWGSLKKPEVVYVEAEKGARTGRWCCMRLAMEEHPPFEPPRFFPTWPPVAINTHPNPAAARVPLEEPS
jgi:hypothetical protein